MMRRRAPAPKSRYLEEVTSGSAGLQSLANVWCGTEEDHDGLSVRSERLELREDGSFEHTLGHEMALVNDLRGPESSSCVGRWRLYNVRYFGADLAAAADQEISFERGKQSPPLLTESIVVCGQNPQVNGFLGVACRLYPETLQRGRTQSSTTRQQNQLESHGEDMDTRDAIEADVQTMTAEAEQLAKATGHPLDECFAALLQHGGSVEEAAILLLQNPIGSNDDSSGADATTTAPTEEELQRHAQALVEATGKPLGDCVAALHTFKGRSDDAAAYLLNLSEAAVASPDAGEARERPGTNQLSGPLSMPEAPTAAVNGELSDPPSTAEALSVAGTLAVTEPPTVAEHASEPLTVAEQAMRAARLTDITGKPFATCLSILQKHQGCVNEAAAELLDMGESNLEQPSVLDEEPPLKQRRCETSINTENEEEEN